MSHTCQKEYIDIPFAHRQHLHAGHCSLIHGHNWSFIFTFAALELDSNGFVADFGDLKWIKKWLEDKFDHALVLNQDDPHLKALHQMLSPNCFEGVDTTTMDSAHLPCFAKIAIVPNCGAEGLAEYVGKLINQELIRMYEGRVYLLCLTVREDSKNSATYNL